MKKIYLLHVMCLLAIVTVNAQYVTLYTPKGSSIETFIIDEYTNEEIYQITEQYKASYGSENVLAPASRKYNCHSYAWNLSEGGSQKVWMNQYDRFNNPNIRKYWEDGSYVETTASEGEKIFYYNGDHSAIKSKTIAGKYESKWGKAPLMRHKPTEGPSIYNMTYRKYYKKVPPSYSISGPSTVCEEATYSIENLPAGASVEWSVENPKVHISNNGIINSVNISDTTTVYSKIYFNNNSIFLKKKIFMGISPLKISTGGCLSYVDETNRPNKGFIFIASPFDIESTEAWQELCSTKYPSFHWGYRHLPNGAYTHVESYYNLPFNSVQPIISFPSVGYYRIEMRLGETSCYFPVHTYDFYVDEDCISRYNDSYSFSLYPNPASAVVNLELNELVQAEAQATECRVSRITEKVLYEIQLWNSTGILKAIKSTQSKVQIPLSGLPKGLYYVLVIKDGKTERQKLVVE